MLTREAVYHLRRLETKRRAGEGPSKAQRCSQSYQMLYITCGQERKMKNKHSDNPQYRQDVITNNVHKQQQSTVQTG
jgi:hypothetical protein